MTDNKTPPRFMTIEQAAGELNVFESQIRALLKTGDPRGIQIGPRGLWRIGTADLEWYIDQAYNRIAERIAAGEIDEAAEEQG